MPSSEGLRKATGPGTDWGVSRSGNPLWNVWANDKGLLNLYRGRCRRESPEMTCAAQLADLVKQHVPLEETILDAGCGGGYYYLSLLNKSYNTKNYYGIDFTQQMIDLAREEIGKKYLSPDHFQTMFIEDLDTQFDNIICFHVLSTAAHYLMLLDRLLSCTKKRLFLRENIDYLPSPQIYYEPDRYLDEDKRHMHVYHVTIPKTEIEAFCVARGFRVTEVPDERTKGGIEMVCDLPHRWRILLVEKL